MLSPSPSPSPSPSNLVSTVSSISRPSTLSKISFTPPLIAMVVVVAAAFIIVTYSRLISRKVILLHRRYRRYRLRRRHRHSISSDVESSPYDPSDGFHISSPYGLDDYIIKSLPLSVYARKSGSYNAVVPVQHDCAVCLLEFEEKEYIRTLPVCYHVFHVDCIDIWLRSHANCPLCRAGILLSRPGSPFVPAMAGRIRPSFEDLQVFESPCLLELLVEELPKALEGGQVRSGEITHEPDQDGFDHRRDFLLKRSYSFSFERNLGSERLAFEPGTASPFRFRRGGGGGGGLFGPFGKPRVFSFRYYRGMKSPFFRRRSGGFFPLSERYGGGGSSRRSKSMASPMFMRSAGPTVGQRFSSSRMRSGDPEALLSPERFNRR